MKRIFLPSLILLNCGCSVDRTVEVLNPNEKKMLSDFQLISEPSKLHITSENELGERLKLCLKFVNKENKKPLISQKVKFYHTSSNGNYEPSDPNDETTARLNGNAVTDSQGRIYIETILPGNYGSSGDSRHIHTTIYGAKPEGYDIHFNQYTGRMGRNFINGSDQHFLADLKYAKDSTLNAFLTIEVKRPNIKN